MGEDQDEQFEGIFTEHLDAVLRFALRRVEPDTAKDVAAETFFAAWRSLDSVPDEPRAWLLTVARHKIADHYRASGRQETAKDALTAVQRTASPDPADSVTEHDHIRAALARLPAADQELLRLLAWDGLTRTEAAEVLGTSAALFRVRLHRARRRFRRALADEEPAPEIFTSPPRSDTSVVIPESS